MPDYELLAKQVEGFLDTEPYWGAALSNAAALLWESMEEINWAGFYLVRDGRLVLAPFQGKPACIHIEKGKGVCGTAWEKDETIVVEDVHEFPGHIACDSASRSEIVIPLHKADEVVAVMDIDSPQLSRFSNEDREGLEKFAQIIECLTLWE